MMLDERKESFRATNLMYKAFRHRQEWVEDQTWKGQEAAAGQQAEWVARDAPRQICDSLMKRLGQSLSQSQPHES